MKTVFISLAIVVALLSYSEAQFGGSLSSNLRGGYDGTVHYSQGIGSHNHNLAGTVFGSKNSLGGPPTYGGAVNYNKLV